MGKTSLKDNNKLSKYELIILWISAVLTITFVSTCSPLYPFNPWDDANCFFTIGRGMVKGRILYKDLFDHKGPLLYFVYALTALISGRSFIGAWIVECIMAGVFAVYSWKTVKLFVSTSKNSVLLIPVFIAVVYTSKMFNFGGNAEELCFPLITIALYKGLKAVVKGDGLPEKADALICGILAGAIFWVKYTFVGFFAGFCLFIIVMAIKRKAFLKLWSLIWRFITGLIIITIPVLLYFVFTNSLNYLWESYFYDNMAFYLIKGESSNPITGIPVIENIVVTFYCLINSSLDYPSFGILMLLSVASVFFVDKQHKLKTALLFLGSFLLAAGFVFTRPVYIYYYGYILCYGYGMAAIPCVKLFVLIEKAAEKNLSRLKAIVLILPVFAFAFTIFMCKNMYLIFKPKDFLAQFRMAETINQTEDAKILTYDTMDAGFYTAAGLLPSNRYFGPGKNLENNFPDIKEQKDRLIEEGYFDYIVTTYFLEPDWDNYELVQEEADLYIDYTGEPILDGHKLYKRI